MLKSFQRLLLNNQNTIRSLDRAIEIWTKSQLHNRNVSLHSCACSALSRVKGNMSLDTRRNRFVQVGPNKFVSFKPEVSSGTMISSDIADNDLDSHELTRKTSKTDIKYPVIVAESPYENDYENLYYDGVHFSELHITHCRASWNNLIVNTYDKDMNIVYYTTAKLEGYKNAKKKSPVVNQQVGSTVARRLLKLGIKCTRVVLEGVRKLKLYSSSFHLNNTIVSLHQHLICIWANLGYQRFFFN